MKVYLSNSQQPGNKYYGGAFNEQEVMHNVAQKTAPLLERMGFTVKVSPIQTMRQNINEANAWGADIYVALHTNAMTGRNDGTLALYWSSKGKMLAQCIYDEVARLTPSSDEGMRQEKLAELYDTIMTAALIEIAYHDNRDDFRFIMLNQQEIAEAVAKGIWKYSEALKAEQKPVIKGEYSTYYDSRDRQTSHVIRCRPEDIEIRLLGGTLHDKGVNGINGTFFDTPRPQLPESCWGLAVNNGIPIGPNAHTVDWKGRRRGTVWFDGKRLHCDRINDYREAPGIQWGISGVMLVPEYSNTVESYESGVYRKTNHSIIGYDKKGDVYLIVRTDSTMERLVQSCAFFGLVGAVSLDGGESSQLRFGEKGYRSSRAVNNAVLVRG